ncbi:MAG: phage baseplate assembly protein V, partial [Kofleriaceae bacterium]
MAGEFDTHDPRYTALYIGHVVERADPERLGRVRVRIPGLIEPASTWAFPLGTVGGGADRRGFFAVPETGAEVGVLFHQGDVDHPYYLCGHWGKPAGATEIPAPARQLSDEDTPQVRAFETGRYVLAFDDRAGKESLVIQDKKSGDQIELDGASMGITIKGTAALLLKADGVIAIEGTTVVINGR